MVILVFEVKIERLDHQGRGICKVNDRITFVPNTLIDEIVQIELIEKKKKYNVGRVIKYIKKSNLRVNPICPYYELCGGCDLMHLSYEEQLKYKQDKIKNIFSKYTDIDINLIKDIVYDKEYNYRNKGTFKVNNEIGYYRKNSHEIIPIDNCYLLSDKINEILKLLNNCILKNIKEVIIKNSDTEILVIFKGENIDKKIIDTLKGKVTGIVLFNKEYKVIYGKGKIESSIGAYKFLISPEAFFQVNNNIAKKMYDKVSTYLNNENNVLDLYSGTGSIGIYVSKFVKNIISVEINKFANLDALENKKINNISNIEFICDDVANVIDKFSNIDTVIVDPPRSGLDSKTIKYLKKIGSKNIIYVSCDPLTLARDIKNLSDNYMVKEVTLFDMFPNTYHVECVCILKSK